ncbi:MAG TPA: carboxylesterase family protein, partial [Pseudomonadales bacterium]|nr:carboxylesterase family protein [Pseudomonadales bacterium]
MDTQRNGRLRRRQFLKRAGQFGALAMAARWMPAFATATGVTQTVQTTEGPIRGLIDDGVQTYLGIPYAAPPVGSLRFQPPIPPQPHQGVFDAVHYGHSAMQLPSGPLAVHDYPGTLSPALAQLYDTRGDLLTQNEDCLVLNVWAPLATGKLRPVMVWFHNGGYNQGSGSWPAFDGHNLALHQDVIVVTVNHRLNAFGFLNLAEIGGDKYAHSGVVGQLDLVRSLEWVRDNIAAFGGDPGNVTIFGQSGGGAKVSILHNMPSAVGLFHRCIIESGAALRVGDPSKASEQAEKVLRELGISNQELSRLENMCAADIQKAVVRVGGHYGPILDVHYIPEQPFSAHASVPGANVPMIIGTTRDEATIFEVGAESWRDMTNDDLVARINKQFGRDHGKLLLSAYRKFYPNYSPRYLYTAIFAGRAFLASVTLAERKIAQRSGDVYLYVFAWDCPVDDGILKAPHTMDIPFVFDNVEKGPLLLGDDRSTRRLGDTMSRAWATFARSGDPNTRMIPRWKPYD